MYDVTVITSAFNFLDYIDSYLLGISKMKEVSQKISINIACASISNTYSEQEHRSIFERLKVICIETGLGLSFYAARAESYPVSVNKLLKNTLDSSLSFIIVNSDDAIMPQNLLNRVQALKDPSVSFCWSDYACVKDIKKVLKENYSLGETGFFYEKTYEAIDYNNKRAFYSRFLYGPSLHFNADVVRKIGYYNENYSCACDYDYINRMIWFNLKGVKVEGLGTLFLQLNKGLSTRPDTKGVQEGYRILECFIGNKHPCIISFGEKVLWRNL